MDKTFNFAECEARINEKWLAGDYFRAQVNPDKKPYTIIMPPPNITSRLHIGHARTYSIQDAIIRFKRMQGYEALWLPGADHAAIATEARLVKELAKQGIEKSSLTREQFMGHIQKWYDTYTAQIIEQFKRMGFSCDWSRFAFTMDERTTRAVKEAFNRLREKNLIYQGERMINWCPNCRSTLSDEEVDYKPENHHMYHIKYGEITVATTRPETMFGDVAIAVNPNDARYKKYIGKTVSLPLTNRVIPVIADDYVDMKFGTGALKITPAHDMADNQVGVRHGLAAITVIDECGRMMKSEYVPDELCGLDRDAARAKTVELLKKSKLLAAQKSYSGNVGKCYRCFDTVEPRISRQWFVKMKDLAKPCIDALDNGLAIFPKKFKKVYLHWLNNIKDWCISRQLTSGHKIPIDGETDTLDTWFSSALWPLCTLGWPDKTADFEYFYPTQTMVSAHDIIFFWIIRMLFSGIEYTGKLPFENVLLLGLVRDAQGRKMSKSLGNGIDPVDVIEKYGVDAMRFSLFAGTQLDRDPRYNLEKAELARNFINKIWNAVKFYTMMERHKVTLEAADRWILTKLFQTVKSVTKKYEKFDFGVAASELQSFFWNDVCDWYIEESKRRPNYQVMAIVIENFLKLLHPIMPFVTEEINDEVFGFDESLVTAEFPLAQKDWNSPKEFKEFEKHIAEVKRERAAEIDSRLLEKKIQTLKKEIEKDGALLGNRGFVEKAPKAEVERVKTRLEDNKKMLATFDKT